MNYISAKNAAEKWGIGVRRVQFFCANEKIPGAKRVGNQWLIPEDALYPADGRTRGAKEAGSPYHFPLLLFSRYYLESDELSPDELVLLESQKAYLKGQYSEVVALARPLTTGRHASHVTFGGWLMVGYGAILLGVLSEYKAALKAMAALLDAEVLHKEDFRILLKGLRHHVELTTEAILQTDAPALSADGVVYYQYLLMMSAVVERKAKSRASLCFYSTLIRQAEIEGVEPLLLSLNAMFSVLTGRLGDRVGQRQHMEEACRIAVRNGWCGLLAKYYAVDTELINDCMLTLDATCIPVLMEYQRGIITNLVMIRQYSVGFSPIPGYTADECEFLVLASYGLSLASISSVKNVSFSTVNRVLDRLRVRLDAQDDADLQHKADALLAAHVAEHMAAAAPQ